MHMASSCLLYTELHSAAEAYTLSLLHGVAGKQKRIASDGKSVNHQQLQPLAARPMQSTIPVTAAQQQPG
jgi:hypothetical protein